MADNPVPPPPAIPPTPVDTTTPAPKPVAVPAPPKSRPAVREAGSDRAWVRPLGILAVAAVIIAVFVFWFGYAYRAKPIAGGFIIDATAVQMQDNTVLAAIQLNVANVNNNPLYIKEIKATVKTDQGEYTDDAATATDSARYFQAFPALAAGATEIIKYDTKIQPGQKMEGTIVVSFPITKAQFDARKSLSVRVQPFDVPAVVLTK